MSTHASYYASHSVFSDPGAWASELDAIPANLAAISEVVNRLVFHYRAGGDWAEHGITLDRIGEIDTRYAGPMLGRVLELNPHLDDAGRAANQRMIGCCRDFTLLFVAIARHKGFPVRSRVGFSAYFMPGLNLDHVVAEAWDEQEQRWRLIDAELHAGHTDPNDGTALDPLDLGRNQFIVAPQAWLVCRAGEADPETFLVAPDFDIPGTRSWPYLLHNLVHDVAALNKREMILWDDWGISQDWDSLTEDQMSMLDEVAKAIISPDAPLEEIGRVYDRDEFRVPGVVTSYTSSAEAPPIQVELLAGVAAD